MSNLYGLDFLKSEHQLPNNDNAAESDSSSPDVNDNNDDGNNNYDSLSNNDLEKQYQIITFLQKHRSSGFLPPSIIYQETGIDLSSADLRDQNNNSDFVKSLLQNKKICTEEVPDPENPSINIVTFGYAANFAEVTNKARLLAKINACTNGVSYRQLSDSYIGVETDLDALITAGDIIAIENKDTHDKTLFPRGEQFLVELDGNIIHESMYHPEQQNAGNIASSKSSQTVNITRNPTSQIRRGEAVWIGGQWFRVSSAVKEGVELKKQPPRAQAPPSVVLRKDLSKKNDQDGYLFPFTSKNISGDAKLLPETIENLVSAKKAREIQTKAFSDLKKLASNSLQARSLLQNGVADVPSITATNNTNGGANGIAPGQQQNSVGLRKRPSSHHRFGVGNASSGMSKNNTHSYDDRSHQKKNQNGLSVAQAKAMAIENAQNATQDPNLAYSFARRHGCTKDVRDMYLATRAQLPQNEHELYQKLVEAKLIEPHEAMRRPIAKKKKLNVDNDGKPKKMRYYVNKKNRLTNTHLEGTDLERKLMLAIERSAQGKDVGDGGM